MKDRIKKIRKTLNLTQQEFADRIGIKRGGIANYEIGRNDPSDSVISLICREFDINETWLRTGEGEMFVQAPSTEMEMLARKYHLSEGTCILIEKIINLKPEEQEIILNFIMDSSTSLMNQRTKASVTPIHSNDPDIETAVAEYRRQLELERRLTAESAVSEDTVTKKGA